MDVSGIRSTRDIGQAAGLAASSGREELGKTEFMELMVAQFNNQNPLEPTKNEDFIAQLAQFSSLEGIQNLNASVDAMAAAMRSSSTMQAAALVGRSVLAPADRALTDGSGLAGNVVNTQPNAGEQMPAGSYRVNAYAMTGEEPTQLSVELPEVVSSISFGSEEATLNLAGGASVRLSEVRELQ